MTSGRRPVNISFNSANGHFRFHAVELRKIRVQHDPLTIDEQSEQVISCISPGYGGDCINFREVSGSYRGNRQVIVEELLLVSACIRAYTIPQAWFLVAASSLFRPEISICICISCQEEVDEDRFFVQA